MYGSHLIPTAPLGGKRGGDDLNFAQSRGPEKKKKKKNISTGRQQLLDAPYSISLEPK